VVDVFGAIDIIFATVRVCVWCCILLAVCILVYSFN